MRTTTVIDGVPLFRDILKCRRKDHAAASIEVIWCLSFATLPIWLGAILISMFQGADAKAYLHEFFVSGEVLLISCALIGPSIYIITKKYGDLPNSLTISFPQAQLLGLISFGISIVTAGIIGAQRMHSQLSANAPNKSQLFNVDRIEALSILFLVVTIMTLYVVSLFKSYTEDGAASEMRTDETDYVKKFKKWKPRK